jgi:hypothetical protein
LLLPDARDVAVEKVGDARRDEDREGEPGAEIAFDEEGGSYQGRGRDAAVGEDVRHAECAGGRRRGCAVLDLYRHRLTMTAATRKGQLPS